LVEKGLTLTKNGLDAVIREPQEGRKKGGDDTWGGGVLVKTIRGRRRSWSKIDCRKSKGAGIRAQGEKKTEPLHRGDGGVKTNQHSGRRKKKNSRESNREKS